MTVFFMILILTVVVSICTFVCMYTVQDVTLFSKDKFARLALLHPGRPLLDGSTCGRFIPSKRAFCHYGSVATRAKQK